MTNRMELAFKGLPKRGFQYTFKMIPKSEQEAEEVRNIEDLDFVPFNSDGSEDVTVTPAEDDETFKEYKYSATGLNDFTSFQLKIVMKGTISSYPPRIRDMRGIALAV